MNSLPIRAVFFDLDGTLIQTSRIFEKTLQKLGITYPPFDSVAHFLSGADWRALIEYLFRNQQEKIDSIREQFFQYYQKHLFELNEFYPQALETLAQLKERGLVVGIISNKMHEICLELDKHLYFNVDFLLGSGKIPFKKPHPAPLIYGCKAFKLSPAQCLYVGDMPTDLQAARWAGFEGIYARYGLHHHFNKNFNPKKFIDNLEDILKFIS